MASVLVWDLFKVVENSSLAICNKCKAEVSTDRGVKTINEILLNGGEQRFGNSEIGRIDRGTSHEPLLHT